MPIHVIGLDRSRLIPDEMMFALKRFREELIPPLVEDFRRSEPPGGTWPKGRRKTIQAQTKGIIRGPAVIIGTFNSRFARSLDTGLTVAPRKKTVMRFRNQQNQFVFSRKPITHAPRPFFGRVLTGVPAIVQIVYARVFSSIGSGRV